MAVATVMGNRQWSLGGGKRLPVNNRCSAENLGGGAAGDYGSLGALTLSG